MRVETFTVEQASRVLGISLPTTENALKSAFRRRSREVHPDHSPAVDATEQFQTLTAVYEYARTQAAWLLDAGGAGGAGEPLECVDGTPLADLGKGLGPTTNGRPCANCESRGFTRVHAESVPCPDCRGDIDFGSFWFGASAVREYRCTRCGGDGKFKRGGRVVGDCRGCGARGWVKRRGVRNDCRTCRGEGRVPNPHGRYLYSKCGQCEGTGEILVFNPVIPKGLLQARR